MQIEAFCPDSKKYQENIDPNEENKGDNLVIKKQNFN